MIEVVVGSVMAGPVATCKKGMLLTELVQSMQQGRRSCVVVIEDNKPVGIVTERDLVGLLNRSLNGEKHLKEAQVAEIMTGPPVTVHELTPLFDALVITQTQGFRHLPVVDDNGYLVGILTYSDLACAYESIMNTQRRALEEEVGNKTRYLKEINQQLKTLSMQDALLGIGNRRAMEVDVAYTHKAASEQSGDYALVLFDVDHFKQYNDIYGHQAGDDALKKVTEAIKACIRTTDRVYRYGGEELLLLMAGTSQSHAKEIAERTVKMLSELGIPHEKGEDSVLTVSAGVGSFKTVNANEWDQVLKRADTALYEAKSSGRNQVREAK